MIVQIYNINITLRKEKWSDKLCNGILQMVLGEEMEDPARRADELWNSAGMNCGKGVQESKQNLAGFETTGPVKSSMKSWSC